VEAGDIVRNARRRAGLTQEQLAIRSGVHRNYIGGCERGQRNPTFERLQSLVNACGLELVIHLAEQDHSLDELAADQLALAPAERLGTMLRPGPATWVLDALRWLADVRTPAILIGEVAAALQGLPQLVHDPCLEIVSRDPVSTEAELDAAGFEPSDSEARWRETDRRLSWRNSSGATVEIATHVPGNAAFQDLWSAADVLHIDDDAQVVVAHPRDLLRLADASPKESARARVPGLRALLSQRARGDR
jgi:transcriptional regulator with XRE-family HTH domain